jgi:hypothetical protein
MRSARGLRMGTHVAEDSLAPRISDAIPIIRVSNRCRIEIKNGFLKMFRYEAGRLVIAHVASPNDFLWATLFVDLTDAPHLLRRCMPPIRV